MLRFSANLTMMFNEVDFTDRFERAAGAGFKGVEYLFPYGWSMEQLVDKLGKHHLKQVLHNLPAGNWQAGERIEPNIKNKGKRLKNLFIIVH